MAEGDGGKLPSVDHVPTCNEWALVKSTIKCFFVGKISPRKNQVGLPILLPSKNKQECSFFYSLYQARIKKNTVAKYSRSRQEY